MGFGRTTQQYRVSCIREIAIMKLPEWFSLSASQLQAEASETDQRNKKPGSVPPSLRRSHPQMSHIYMSDPRALKPLSYKDVDTL